MKPGRWWLVLCTQGKLGWSFLYYEAGICVFLGGCILGRIVFSRPFLVCRHEIYHIYLFHIQVWSPAGGWWNYAPPNWQRNTVIAHGVVLLCSMTLFTISAAKEHRPLPPFRPIPSQSWARHAAAEDPRLNK